jgi:uracil-DNA glycosylase family 4
MQEFSFTGTNPKCEGCPALAQHLPRHTILDYEYEEAPVDILFISDSPKMFEGEYVSFRPQEFRVIMQDLRELGVLNNFKVAFTTSVKCPNITPDSLSTGIRKKCAAHLYDTIDHYKPKLTFACGKMATTMLYGKAREEGKVRGKVDVLKTPSGFVYKVVPIIHPFQVVAEPKNAYLFSTDLHNAVNNELLGKSKDARVPYTMPMSIAELDEVRDDFIDTDKDLAVDIETTGLNFLEDTIHTVSMTLVDRETGELGRTLVLPIDHKEAKLGYKIKGAFLTFVCKAMANKKNRKILQNAGFDLKFMKRYGVDEVYNVYDTKLLQHLYREDVPKSLADLVSYYFPEEKF